mmetsp:Transcript_4790/g.17193  ORF Transcript_4790/g.17193 Transcript_4790/m.17193 type:complete len:207 (-) Transcript_4790:2216-2836(-)
MVEDVTVVLRNLRVRAGGLADQRAEVAWDAKGSDLEPERLGERPNLVRGKPDPQLHGPPRGDEPPASRRLHFGWSLFLALLLALLLLRGLLHKQLVVQHRIAQSPGLRPGHNLLGEGLGNPHRIGLHDGEVGVQNPEDPPEANDPLVERVRVQGTVPHAQGGVAKVQGRGGVGVGGLLLSRERRRNRPVELQVLGVLWLLRLLRLL